MGLAIEEQETTITMMRSEDAAEIYTSDTTMMTKLDKCVSKGEYSLVGKTIVNGEVVAKTYKCPKKLVSFRSKSSTRQFTDEEREDMRQRLAKARGME